MAEVSTHPPVVKEIKPNLETPVSSSRLETESKSVWTEKGKAWFRQMWEKLIGVTSKPREVLEEVAKVPDHEKEFMTTEPSVEPLELMWTEVSREMEEGFGADRVPIHPEPLDQLLERIDINLDEPRARNKTLTPEERTRHQLPDRNSYDIATRYHDRLGRLDESNSISLLERDGTMFTIFDHRVGKLRVIEVYEPNVATEMSADLHQLPVFYVRNLIIVNPELNCAWDFASRMADGWKLRHIPAERMENFRENFQEEQGEKYIQYNDLNGPERLLALFHEYAHGVRDIRLDPTVYKAMVEVNEKASQESFGFRAPRNITFETAERFRELLAPNERMANLGALWLARRLKQQGIDIGMTAGETVKFVSEKNLADYERIIPIPHLQASRFLKSQSQPTG